MAVVAVAFDVGGSIRRCLMASAMDNGNGKAMARRMMAGTTRGREGGARGGNATTSRHNERTRGWHDKRMMRDDATTSW
jgi:hypothetical protein